MACSGAGEPDGEGCEMLSEYTGLSMLPEDDPFCNATKKKHNNQPPSHMSLKREGGNMECHLRPATLDCCARQSHRAIADAVVAGGLVLLEVSSRLVVFLGKRERSAWQHARE